MSNFRRKYFKALLPDDPNYLPNLGREEVPEAQANLISSLADDNYNSTRLDYDKRHYPILDLDFPCELIPSSTEGKFHLYMNKEVTWLQYQNVLTAMAAAGLLEPGFVGASIAAGTTFLRKPGVYKIVK